jgi:Asp-tRNA(Asn)/Glu-tRNA(Gln) amidotransferase A subunit family amidase
LFGLKPSRGLTVSEDDFAANWSGLSVNHVLTRSVRDSAAFLDVLRLSQPGAFALPVYGHSYFNSFAAHPGHLRVAVQRVHPGGHPLHQDCLDALDRAVRLCEAHGFLVEDCVPPVDHESVTRSMIKVINTHVAQIIVPQLQVKGVSLSKTPVEEATRRMTAAGSKVSAVEFIEALDTLRHAEAAMAVFHEGFDLLLSPVLAQPPAPLGWLNMDDDSMRVYAQRFASYGGFAALYNGTGQPSIALPLHRNDKGLPIGVMFSAAWGQDHRLLQVANLLSGA